jgi:hypothetical protein
MKFRRRLKLSTSQRIDMWGRGKAGQSLNEIGRAPGKDHVVIHFLLAQYGGMVPATRQRSLRTLTLTEREDISRGIASGSSIREIAKGLRRAVSTVSREVARHGGRHGIERVKRITKPGSLPCAPKCVFWPFA